MANMQYGQLGLRKGGTNERELFETTYAAELMTAWQALTVVEGYHKVRNINQAKSATFPLTGVKVAKYHVPGTQITGTRMDADTKEIHVDAKLYSDSFFDSYTELMDMFDLRQEYVRQDAEALAQAYDLQVLRVMINAARTVAESVEGHAGGTELINADYATDLDLLVQAFGLAQSAFSEKRVMEKNRTAFMKSLQYWTLVNNDRVINQDMNTTVNGGVDTGVVKTISQIKLIEAQNYPTGLVTGGQKEIYNGDFSNSVAVITSPSAVGTVRLQDLSVESDYLIDYQGDMAVASMGVGHDVLRQACALELKTA